MDDRLGDLAGDRLQQLDLVGPELTRLPRADVERAGQLLAGKDRDGEDRLVLRLRQVRELLPARVQVGLRRDRNGTALRRRGAGDPLSWTQARAAGHRVEWRAVRGAQDELAGRLVVEVDEARIGVEGCGDLVRDEVQYLLEVERGVDGGDRLRQQPQVALGRLHEPIVGASRALPPNVPSNSLLQGRTRLGRTRLPTEKCGLQHQLVTVCYEEGLGRLGDVPRQVVDG